ncbi:MAG: hypothetical protein G3I10_00950, partial [Ferrovum sp.]|nr:hypothetical protein [Ferrovum sp.]
MSDFWGDTLNQIRSELPEQQFTTWIKPLQAEISNGS